MYVDVVELTIQCVYIVKTKKNLTKDQRQIKQTKLMLDGSVHENTI